MIIVLLLVGRRTHSPRSCGKLLPYYSSIYFSHDSLLESIEQHSVVDGCGTALSFRSACLRFCPQVNPSIMKRLRRLSDAPAGSICVVMRLKRHKINPATLPTSLSLANS